MKKNKEFHLDYYSDWFNDVRPLLEEIRNHIDKNYTNMIINHVKQGYKNEKKIPTKTDVLEIIAYIQFKMSTREERKILGGPKIEKYSFIIYFDMRPDLSSFPKIYETSGKLHKAFDTIEFLDDILKQFGIEKDINRY